ncbi:hypothetical protein JNUCC23_05990 [Peribacillus sp. JNUCC 23]
MSVATLNVATKYPILNNPKDIQQNLTVWQNRGGEILNPTLIKVEHLGESDTYIAFFRNQSGDLGIATMKEGPNKKLKILNSHYGTVVAGYNGVKTDTGNYGIITGKNPNKQIYSIQVVLQDDSLKYKVKVPEDAYFIIVKELPKGISSNTFADLYLFDKEKKEIKQY